MEYKALNHEFYLQHLDPQGWVGEEVYSYLDTESLHL